MADSSWVDHCLKSGDEAKRCLMEAISLFLAGKRTTSSGSNCDPLPFSTSENASSVRQVAEMPETLVTADQRLTPPLRRRFIMK